MVSASSSLLPAGAKSFLPEAYLQPLPPPPPPSPEGEAREKRERGERASQTVNKLDHPPWAQHCTWSSCAIRAAS